MEFCIVKPIADKIKKDIADGKLSFDDLMTSSTERHAIFSRYMPEELAHSVNGEFEKALTSKQKAALQEWVTKTFKQSEQENPVYQSTLKKINELDQMGTLNPSNIDDYLYDLVAEKMGISLSPEELTQVSQRATNLQKLSETRSPNGGFTLEYWKEKTAMDDFIQGLNPTHGLRIATSVVGRANLLGIPSMVTNITANVTPAATMAITRRIYAGRITGKNSKLAGEMWKEAHDIYMKTRVDVTRMDELNPRGELRMGEQVTHTKGEGELRKVADVYSDVIYNFMQGYPDYASASAAFYDSLNLYADKMVAKMGIKGQEAVTKAAELMKDANRVDALTAEGQLLRKLSIADARYSTFTEKGKFGELALGIRKVIDNATGDWMAGEFSMPFVKQPANSVQRAVEASGIGGVRAVVSDFPQAIRAIKKGDASGQLMLQNATRRIVESGFGMSFALALVYGINPDDFIPEYSVASPKDRELVNAKNATYNSVKIGGKYISLDYFGVLSAPLVGWLYARKFGNNLSEKAVAYGQGVIGQASRTPGVSELSDMVGSIIESGQRSENIYKALESNAGNLISSIIARAIPASGTISNIDKGTDVQRQSKNDFISKIVSSVPFLRRILPEKINETTGEVKQNENLASVILFGARVKTAENDPVVMEIQRLTDVGSSPALQNIEYSSKQIKGIQDKYGEKILQEAIKYYGEHFNTKVTKLIQGYSYKKMNDEDKMKAINSIRSDLVDYLGSYYKTKSMPKTK
jgi:hypothetical protein